MRAFLLPFLVFIIAGCSTTNSQQTNTPNSAVLSTGETSTTSVNDAEAESTSNLNEVASDFVSLMPRLREFPLLSTTFQYSEAEFMFAREIVQALRDAGYGTQKVSADQGSHYIEFARSETNSGSSTSVMLEYSMTVAGITLSRVFDPTGPLLVPITPLAVQGSRPQPIAARDNEYDETIAIDRSLASIEFRDANGNLVSRINPGVLQPDAPLNSNKVYFPEKQLVVRFVPNTLDIGRNNKNAIKFLMDSFDETDRFTLSACHTNRTSQWDGTQELALKRGERVKQELLLLGVPELSTNIERCNENGYVSRLEKFSVVLTLESASRNTTGRSRSPRARYGFF